MGEFLAWYWKQFLLSLASALLMHKSVPGWIAFGLTLTALAALIAPAVTEISEEGKKAIFLIAPIVIVLIILVFGPLWYAFQESQTQEAKLKTYESASVEIKKIELTNLIHPNYQAIWLFCAHIENGPITIRPEVLLKDFSGTPYPPEKTHRAHWRNQGQNHSKELIPGEFQQFGLLGIHKTPSGNPGLFIWDTDEIHKRWPLTKDVPLEDQQAVKFKITVVGKFEIPSGKDGEFRAIEKELAAREYLVNPAPGTEIGYTISQILAGDFCRNIRQV